MTQISASTSQTLYGCSELTAQLMQDCVLCPRKCHANRLAGEKGFCGQTYELRAARASLHMWEEPCISGTTGSGTVFFSGCNLRCVFCQNHTIALGQNGTPLSTDRLAEIFLSLEEKKACNINLVTPTHFVPQIREALQTAKARGLRLPVVYNTSSYETVETLRLLDGLVDIYLPDLKYFSQAPAALYSHAPDYFAVASAAIEEMVRQTGAPAFDPQTGLMTGGVIVRHLLLPGQIKDSKKLLRYLYNTYGDRIYISIMNQYTPLPHVDSYPELCRKITPQEYERVLDFACRIGIQNGFFQDGDVADESFIPSFDNTGL